MQFCKLDGIYQNVFVDEWVEFLDVKLNKWAILFIGNINKPFQNWTGVLPWVEMKFWNQFLLIFLMISLVTLPSSFLAGLINRHGGFFRKSGLWSLSLTKTGVLTIQSMHSSRLMSSALVFASKFIDVSNLGWCFGNVIINKFFMLLFGHFMDITCFVWKDKNVWWLFYIWNVLF